MRSRVVVRSFYEDAYLGFFVRYYLDIGFDEIVILKSDADIFGGPRLPEYAIESGLITKEELESGRIRIIPVYNCGNDIIKKNYCEFTRGGVDWVLNVDLDEFIVIDLEAYPGGINEYITRTKERLYAANKVDDPEDVQQLKFRWLCINKMNCQFSPSTLSRVNTITDDIDVTKTDSDLSITKPEGLTLSEYMATNKLELYSFVKSMAARKHLVNTPTINCHFFICNKLLKPKPDGKEGAIHRNYMFIDDLLLRKNTYRSLVPPGADKTCRQGYILHLNTRSLANAFTKCLVTQLRNNKKLQNADAFRQWINSLKLDPQYLTDNREIICEKFMSYLGSKSYFPKKIAAFHRKYEKNIDIPAAVAMFDRTISRLPMKTQQARVGNIDLEWAQLETLCKKNKLPYDKIRAVLELF